MSDVRWRDLLPHATPLTPDAWGFRHRVAVVAAALHAPLVLAVAWRNGFPAEAGVAGALLVAAGAVVACVAPSLRVRSMAAIGALLVASALVMAFTHAAEEARLHIVLVLAVAALYQEWAPLAAVAAYSVVVDPLSFALGIDAGPPWRGAVIDGLIVGAAALAYATQWRANEEVRLASEALVESVTDGILGLDPRGRVLLSNPAAAALVGRAGAALRGRTIAQLVPTLDLRPEAPGTQEFDLPTGQAVEAVVAPLRRRATVRGYAIVLHDVSERRAAEAARLARKEEEMRVLQELEAVRSRFVNMAAHELRTPLMPISLQVQILSARLADADPATRDSLNMLNRNVKRLERLVGDILSVAQLRSGRLPIRRESFDATPMVRALDVAFQPVAARQGIALQTTCPPGLWLDADPIRFEQVLYNLVSNALRYTRDGRIDVVVAVEGTAARVRVTDTGLGLTAEQVARLFQPYTQVHGVASERQGSGLGLFIARTMVELHGGTLSVSSPGPGLGSTFEAVFPDAAPHVRIVDAPRAPHATPTPGPATRSPDGPDEAIAASSSPKGPMPVAVR